MSRWLVPVLAVAFACGGCTTEAPGQPRQEPGDASTPPATSQSPSGEAPPMNSPELDLTYYESRVCDLLTLAQLAPFEIRASGQADDSPIGPACKWNPPDTSAGARIDVGIFTKVREGLEGVYARKDKFAFFEDAGEINGYPAVHRDTVSDGDEGVCTTTVGVRRDQVIDVIVHVNGRNSAEYRKPCAVSDRAASSVIDTVKEGR